MVITVMEDVELRELLEKNVKTKEDLARALWTVNRYAEVKFRETNDWKWVDATTPFYDLIVDYLNESFFDEEEEESC